MSTPSWLVAKPIAHRGLHDRANGILENTIAAARAAIAAGLPIELDLQLTADRDAVVFHDFTLDRLTAEKGAVRERRSADLAGMAIAGSAGDRIPTLRAFLDEIAGRVPLVIEIKSRFDGDTTLTERACAILADYSGPYAIKSFDPAVVAAVRRIAPNVTRGIIGEAHYDHPSYEHMSAQEKHALAHLLHFAESQPQFVSWRFQDLQHAARFLCRRLGNLPVMAWTVRSPEDRAPTLRYADQIVFEDFAV
jgi:glycerophosphoryl diester phosphodiesterase